MKTFNKMAAQGDFLIIRRNSVPNGFSPIKADNGKHVIAHSETGHNHVMDAANVKAFAPVKPDIYTLFLQVDEPTDIVHLRSFDTHETIRVSPGIYEVKRQREYTPEGFRKSQD